jgi:hypothetical protein
MKEFFFPYQTLYHANLGLSNRGYNYIMTRSHFANMKPSEAKAFNHDVKVLTGMLYSIVTLKVFFPFFRSPAEIVNSTKIDAPYPMPSQIAGDQEEQNNPIE